MKQSIEELVNNYDNIRGGKIALVYPEKYEDLCYKNVATILSNAYGNIISYDEIYKRLTSRRRNCNSIFSR